MTATRSFPRVWVGDRREFQKEGGSPQERRHREAEVAKGASTQGSSGDAGDWRVQHNPSSDTVEGVPRAPSLPFKSVAPSDVKKECHLVQTLIRLFLD